MRARALSRSLGRARFHHGDIGNNNFNEAIVSIRAREFNSIIPADSFPRPPSPPAVHLSPSAPPARLAVTFYRSELAAIISPNAVLRKLSSRQPCDVTRGFRTRISARACAEEAKDVIGRTQYIAHTDGESA